MTRNILSKMSGYFSHRPLTLDTLSNTQITMYNECPLKYRFRYIDGRPTKAKPAFSLDFGSIMHLALRDLYRKYPDLKKATIPALEKLYDKTYLQFFFENPRSSEYREEMERGEAFGRETGKAIFIRYWKENRDTPHKVRESEWSFEEDFQAEYREEYGEALKAAFGDDFDEKKVPKKIKYTILGRVDRIDELPGGEIEIIDYKAGRSKVTGYTSWEKDFQLQLYDLACQRRYHRKPAKLSFYYLRFPKEEAKEPVSREKGGPASPQTIEASPGKQRLDRQVYEIGYAIRTGLFKPRHIPHPQKFPCRFCDYQALCPTLKEEVSEEVLEVPVTAEKPALVLSYSQVSTYQQCPQKYHYQYIERRPTLPSFHLDFGNSIHSTLQEFHEKYHTRKEPLETLLGLYQKNWVAKAYCNQEEEENQKSEGERMLRNYYARNKRAAGKPLFLEEDFGIKIGKYEVRGRIDRIDELPGGDWELIDYKAGDRMSSEEELSGDLHPTEINENHQLSLYYLACREKFGKAPQKISLHYLKHDSKVSVRRRRGQIEALREIIIKVGRNIEEGNFEPRRGVLCGWCDFYPFCPAWEKQREKYKVYNTTIFHQAREGDKVPLSYSKMSMFQRCPAQYKAIYVDRLPPRPRAFFDFGTTIHAACEEFYKAKEEPSLEYLLRLYREHWVSVGYSSKEEEERYFQDGLEILRDYYHHFVPGKYRPAPYLEEYFELPIGKEAVMIGYMDRVDKLPDGSYELLDYKTEPNLPGQEEIDKDLQLTIYYWAAKEALNITLSKLSLYYMRFDKKLSTTRQPEDVAKLIAMVDGVSRDIRKAQETGDYPRKVNKYCISCDLKCPLKNS